MSGHSSKRQAFTLIELLIVIAIIALLVGLLLPAVNGIRKTAANAKAQSEIAQIQTAIQTFKTKFNVNFVPATGETVAANNPHQQGFFRLRPSYTAAGVGTALDPGVGSFEARYLKSVWPYLNLSATDLPRLDLDANQTLTFFLTGGTVTSFKGFATNKQKPFLIVGDTVGPFLEFDATKLDAAGHYLDPWGTPYAYFTSIPTDPANSYRGQFDWTNQDGVTSTVTAYEQGTRKIKEKSFQIISAGTDRTFGPGGAAWTPGAGLYDVDEIGGDDLASFKEGTLVTDQ